MTAEVGSADHLFVVGRPRTGSTLLRQMLNRSPRICLAPETHFMRRARHVQMARRLREAVGPNGIRALVDTLYTPDRYSTTGYWNWLRRNVPADEFAERLQITDLTPRALLSLAMRMYAERWCTTADAMMVGEKSPEHLAFVPQLLSWYPRARFIHTFRDPRAIYVSELRRRQAGRWGIKQRLPWLPAAVIDPLLAPIEAAHVALAWRRAAHLDRAYRHDVGDRYLLVRFEDLVVNPESELRRICDFLGIPFDASLLDVRITGSSYAADRHSGEGLDPQAADRWREHLHPAVASFFRRALGRDMARHGYLD